MILSILVRKLSIKAPWGLWELLQNIFSYLVMRVRSSKVSSVGWLDYSIFFAFMSINW